MAVSAAANTLDEERATELHRAAENCDRDGVAALLEKDADPNARDADWETPLHRATRCDDNPVAIEALLEGGAYVNALDDDGETPLHRAVRRKDNVAVVEALLARGANAGILDDDGTTPLHRAVRRTICPCWRLSWKEARA